MNLKRIANPVPVTSSASMYPVTPSSLSKRSALMLLVVSTGFLAEIYQSFGADIATNATYQTTLLGGFGADQGWDVAEDSQGNFVIVGGTQSSNLATNSPAGVFTNYSGGNLLFDSVSHVEGDAFVAKVKPDGTLMFLTYLGGNSSDSAVAVTLDPFDNIYVTGYTSSTNFPVVPAGQAAQSTVGGVPNRFSQRHPYDAFVTKISADGAQVLYSTYVGGDGEDEAFDIQVNATGEAYISGQTASTPTSYPHLNNLSPMSNASTNGAFIAKLNPQGSQIDFVTYLSGNAFESFESLALLPNGTIWTAGFTSSTNLPTLNATQPALAGSFDAYAAQISADGSSILQATYLGGANSDSAYRIALTPSGRPVLAGATSSSDFPVSEGAFQTTFGGGTDDGFIALLPFNQDPLQASYLGGFRNDVAWDVAVQRSGRILVTGITASASIGSFVSERSTRRIDDDFFVLLLNPNLTELLWINLSGAASQDHAFALVSHSDPSKVTILGQTFFSENFPGATQAVQGTRDVFLSQITGLPNPPVIIPPLLTSTLTPEGMISLSWPTSGPQTYNLQSRSNLAPTQEWAESNATVEILENHTARVLIPLQATGAQFFRLIDSASMAE